jgi:3-oxoacyl-[acyl-carrier protein] reductase
MTTTLAGQTALVTGASKGIGRAIALALADRGARVLVHYGRDAGRARSVVESITASGGRAEAVPADLLAPDGAHRLAARVRDLSGGRLDILVANAGLYRSASIEDTTLRDFDDLFAVNVRAPFFVVQQLLPIMGEGGSIVLVSSLAARAAFGTIAAYAASKGALESLARHLALACGARGIRVNAVAPGLVAKDDEEESTARQRRDRALGLQALKRLARPDDIGDVVAFLASKDARWITGDVIRVDGGSSL